MKKILVLLAVFCAAAVFAAASAGEGDAFPEPKLSDPDSWTMVVVPDVQAYVERPRNHGIVDIMNTWVLDFMEPLRIQQVLFTGDLVFRNDQRRLTPDRNSLLSLFALVGHCWYSVETRGIVAGVCTPRQAEKRFFFFKPGTDDETTNNSA